MQELTIAEIQRRSAARGSSIVSDETLSFYGAELLPLVYDGPGQRAFFILKQGESYAIFSFHKQDGTVGTRVSPRVDSIQKAKRDAEAMADNEARVASAR